MEENNTVQSYHEGSCVYRGDGSLDYILHPEGVVRATGQGLSHEYFLKDHLGSTRVVFGSNGAVLQATDYYAFGLEHTPKAKENENRYLYNGKELQDETFAGGVRLGWYDYGWRFYDPQIGRWHSVDPLAEKYRRWSPYNYCVNNPIRFIDPNGMVVDDYQLDKNGDINLIKKTKDDHDVLYASKGDRSIDRSKSINVEKGVLNNVKKEQNQQGQKYSYMQVNNDKAGTQLFEFVANNTQVEWSQIKFGTTSNFISTGQLTGSEPGVADLVNNLLYSKSNVREQIHSHPYRDPAIYKEHGPSCFTEREIKNGTGDRANYLWMKTYYPKSQTVFKVYDATTKDYYKYDDKGFNVEE